MPYSNHNFFFDTGSELIWISKESFHTIIEAHVDELDFHSNVLHRQIRDATRKNQSLVGQSKVIKQLIKSTSKLLKKFNREMINGHVESLHNIMNARFYEHDELIYYEDDVVNERSCMYIIISGGVNIIKTYIELNKQQYVEKEILLNTLQESESFGMHEILLECNRQTSARAVGKTIVLTLEYQQIHQHWIQYDKESKAVYKMSLLLNDKQKYNVYSELSMYSKFMVLFTSHYSRVARRTDVHPTYHGLTVLVDGECEVYQKHHSGGSSDEKTNRTQHKKKHTHHSVAVSPVRKRGGGAFIAGEGGSGRSSAVGSGNHFTVGTIKRIKPKFKFLNDNETNAISLKNSNTILGIVSNGFTFDSTTTENHSFKSRTEISLVRIPPSTLAAHIKHGTNGKILSNRNILLQHLSKNAAVHHGAVGSGGDVNGTQLSNVQNNNRIQQEQQRQQRQQQQLLLLQQPTQQLPFLLQNAMTFVDHSKSSIKSLNLNKSSMMSAASMTGTTTTLDNDVSVPSTRFIPHPPPSRINYSRAAIRSDRVHSNVLKDDHSNQLPPPSSPSLPPVTPRNNGGAVPLKTEQELEYEREMRAGLVEERKIVRQYSPRLNNSIAHRKSRRHKFKPLVNKRRRYRLSKLFNRRGYASKGGHGGYYGGRGHFGGRKNGYTRIHRDYKEEQKKKGLHGDFSLNQANVATATGTGSIELFDSNNYCGPTTGSFF